MAFTAAGGSLSDYAVACEVVLTMETLSICQGQISAVGGIGDVVKPVLAVGIDGVKLAAGLHVDDEDFAAGAAVA